MPKGKATQRQCVECGGDFMAHSHNSQFCGRPCRNAYNNRRMQRGAQLYDLFMSWRYDRTRAKELDLWSIMCRQAQEWRTDDVNQRDGRPSYHDPADHIAANPYLKSIRVLTNKLGLGTMAARGKTLEGVK